MFLQWTYETSTFLHFPTSSPLSLLWHDSRLSSSQYVVSHTSDLLRFLLLHRYGGTYLDLDQIVVQKFPEEASNFIGQENDKYVGENNRYFSALKKVKECFIN